MDWAGGGSALLAGRIESDRKAGMLVAHGVLCMALASGETMTRFRLASGFPGCAVAATSPLRFPAAPTLRTSLCGSLCAAPALCPSSDVSLPGPQEEAGSGGRLFWRTGYWNNPRVVARQF